MASLNIYSTEWLEVVFSDRNKAYGAYELRRNNPRSTSKALMLGSLLFVTIIVLPPLIRHYFAGTTFTTPLREIPITIRPVADQAKPLVPPTAEPAKPRNDQIKFPPPVAVHTPVTEEPPTTAQLKFAEPGQTTVEGTGGDINIPDVATENISVKDGPSTEAPEIFTRETVQVLPAFPGGPAAWMKFLQGYRYPQAAVAAMISGTVYVSFVVEKDGSLTDIKVLREPGYGTGDEAIRLLKTSAKWKPGIQNGHPVRVAYTQPISLKTQ